MRNLLDKDDLVFNPVELGCLLSLSGLPGGDSKIYDRGPHGNVGTIVGATWVRLPSGLWCLSFDGNDDYINCGNLSAFINPGTGPFCVEYWIHPVSKTGNYIGHVYLYVGPVNARFLTVFHNSNLQIYTNDGNWHDTGRTLTVGTWSHVIWVKEGNTLTLYKNGQDTGWSMNHTASLGPFTLLRIGWHVAYLNGRVALPRIYNRVLSAMEINSHFDREKQLFGVC